MANVKITELTELAAVDLAENDVLPIVDVGSDATKKVTIVSLRDHASANDFITYTLLNANVNTVQDNVATNIASINLVQDNVTVNIASINLVQDNVATNVTNINTVQDNVATNVTNINTVQDNVATNVTNINTVQDNVNVVQDNVAASEANIISYATQANTNLDTKANVSATYFLALANDFATYTQINANLDIVQDNVASVTTSSAAVETRRAANIAGAVSTITTDNLATSKALVSDGSGKVAASSVTSTVLGYLDATSSIQTQLNTKISTTDANAIETRRAANVTLQDTATAAVETRRAANVTLQDTATTAVETRRAANVTLQDTATTAVETRRAANVTLQDTATTAVETRRAANIAGAISTVTTSDLGTAKALVSDGSGKIAVSTVSTTTLQFLDATSSVQTQIDEKAPLASPTFSGLVTAGHDLVVTGNLTVNGETTTVNSENKVIQDRFIMLANAVTGAPSGDVGIFLNRGTSGNAAIYYDESAKSFTLSETRDPDSNTVIAPTGAANLVVGAFSASTISYNGVDLNTAITDNVSTLTTEATAIETRRTANIAGAVSTITTDNLAASKALVSDGSGKVAASSVTSTVLGYLDATSSIQTQLNSKQVTITGAATTIDTENLTASKALVSDGSGKVAVSAVTSTETGYLAGVTSAIQTQINSKQDSLAGATLDLGTL